MTAERPDVTEEPHDSPPAPGPPDAPGGGLDFRALAALIAQVCDLKRVRDARSPRSLAERALARAWSRLAAGENVETVALSEAASAVAAVCLGGLDWDALTANGLAPDEATAALRDAFDSVAGPVEPALRARLRAALGAVPAGGPEPAFVDALVRQPRAGATAPGLPRIVLESAESHADHCFCTAASAVLLAPVYGADAGRVFLTGLAHHLANSGLPDAGFAADTLLGPARAARLWTMATERALAGVPDALVPAVRDALATTAEAAFATPEARAFHAADVLDRVGEMAWHARAARFRLADALGDGPGQLGVCHTGFYQTFQQGVLAAAGLWPPDAAGVDAP